MFLMDTEWIVIGVSGCTNAGKTTLATALKEYYPGTIVVYQDDYFRSDDSKEHVIVPELNHKNWEKLEAVDWNALMENLVKIAGSPPPRKNSLLIIEGHIIYNHPEIRKLFHRMYFLTLSREESKRRRSHRVYTPPDIPKYFDMVVWPMYNSNLNDVIKNCPNVVFLNGEDNLKDIQGAVLKDLELFVNKKG